MERRVMALFLVSTSPLGGTEACSFQRNLETIWCGGKGGVFSPEQIPSRDVGSEPFRELGT